VDVTALIEQTHEGRTVGIHRCRLANASPARKRVWLAPKGEERGCRRGREGASARA
jgi:hypothetical protein